MSKYLKTFAIVMASLLLLTGTASALSVLWFDVSLSTDGGASSVRHRTTASTVGEFLAEQDVELAPFDTVSLPMDAILTSSGTTEITITPGFEIT
ncbi:MAG: ubiquitin-like domain-containing protein, partial [Defluviitaleaceae bacterium]|nr:ubiquitin-like domain-containing protein [Defluviitaleaceae bacterium]